MGLLHLHGGNLHRPAARHEEKCPQLGTTVLHVHTPLPDGPVSPRSEVQPPSRENTPLGVLAFALQYPRELSKWLSVGARHGEFLPAGEAAGSQGLNPPQSCKISVRECQGGRGLLLRGGLNEAQRLDMQVWPCTTPYVAWRGLPQPTLWEVTERGWADCLKINLHVDGHTWGIVCSSPDRFQHGRPDPQPPGPSGQSPRPL